jgi:hypothetical protein
MNEHKIQIFYLLCLLFLAGNSCNTEEDIHFGNYDDQIAQELIKFDTINFNNQMYNIQLRVFMHGKSHFVIGNHIFTNNAFCINLGMPNSDTTFILFDFNMKIKQRKEIKWTINEKIHEDKIFLYSKEYELFLEDLFYDNYYRDSIYKFMLNGYGFERDKDTVCFFVGKKAGIIGTYIGSTSIDSCNYYHGNIYEYRGNIFRYKYNYSLVNFNWRLL